MMNSTNVSHRLDLLVSGGEVASLERAELFAETSLQLEDKAIDTFGTLGSAGTFGGCFGCLGTAGCCC